MTRRESLKSVLAGLAAAVGLTMTRRESLKSVLAGLAAAVGLTSAVKAEGDPAVWGRVTVVGESLDGQDVTRSTYVADDRLGYVLRYKRNADDRCYIDINGKVAREKLMGRVRIVSEPIPPNDKNRGGYHTYNLARPRGFNSGMQREAEKGHRVIQGTLT
jgi:hypothetical protein